MSLKGKVALITGASRGIGREIALRLAKEGVNIVVAAKTSDPHPQLPGTIHTVADEVKLLGVKSLAIQVDVRSEEAVDSMVSQAAAEMGGIDILINNAGAISLSSIEETPMKRFDLMNQVNVRAVYMCSQKSLPYLKKSSHPHILNLSPPMSVDPKWYRSHLAYSLSKYGMTLCTIGLSAELKPHGISVNSLWPKRLIATAATMMLLGKDGMKYCRAPSIMAEAAFQILKTGKGELTGQALLDEEILAKNGTTDFDRYRMDPDTEPKLDLFV